LKAKRLAPGDPAPAFELTAQDGTVCRRADFAGSVVVVAFYPRDRGGLCTRQLDSYASAWDGIAGAGVSLVAISSQDVDSHRAFAAERAFPFRLLADPQRKAIAAWGVEGPLGLCRRASFIVDPDGIVRHAFVSRTGATYESGIEIADRLLDLTRTSGGTWSA
jgi:peroxiredoxin Q/BCP